MRAAGSVITVVPLLLCGCGASGSAGSSAPAHRQPLAASRTEPARTVAVPDVGGMPLARALRILRAHALRSTITAQTRRFRPAQRAFVLQQRPRAGSVVASASRVALFLSVRTHPPGGFCDASLLRLSLGPAVSEATGQHSRIIRVTNMGGDCRLDGYPSIDLRNRHDVRIPFTIRNTGDQMITDRRPGPVLMPTRVAAWFAINKYRCDAGGTGEARIVIIVTDGSAATLTLSRTEGLDYCGSGDPGSIIDVSPYEPIPNATLRH
jgi:hypothetical protein